MTVFLYRKVGLSAAIVPRRTKDCDDVPHGTVCDVNMVCVLRINNIQSAVVFL